MRRHIPQALLAILVSTGCGFTETRSVELRAPTGPTDHRIDTFREGDETRQPPRPFLEVALIQVVGHGAMADAESVVNAMRLRAGELGCDAITRLRVDQGASMCHGYGVCIRYSEAQPGPAVPFTSGGTSGGTPDGTPAGTPAPPVDDGTVHL